MMMMTMVHQFGFISKIENKEIKAMAIKEFNQQTSHHNCAIDTRRVCVYVQKRKVKAARGDAISTSLAHPSSP
jgi:hypothetical protein